ncbi:Neutral/alkaline nonlysosomal ceramidase [Roridomyces roridus]|uniref:Neutral ceramidase n=1 Tax=Roridomyces roridus TaxID=1738132 RepID=A0AAD7FIT1_9AGAR|nr:Neutral/alkaline nonlysosomal ceramidase [Roridomyces roridus]
MHLPLLPALLLSPLDALHALSTKYFSVFLSSDSPIYQPTAMGAADGNYLLGLGIADITGPVVETNMMGYASLGQTDTGLHMRQRVRAFLVADPDAPEERILFLNADIAMGDTGARRLILAELAEEFGNETYHEGNVAFVGTHQHSGVGGYLENLLPQLTALGLSNQSLSAIVSGSVLASRRAHASLAPGTLSLGRGFVKDGSRNRSPTAYLANPEEERAQYVDNGGDAGDQEWGMDVLRFGDGENERGFLSFFAVHGTSIYENNTLISGDNKGMAAYLYESSIEPGAMPGNQTYVAGFVQGAVGDTSPNTLGAFCESPGKPYDGLPCVANSSTCGERAQDCHGRGPAFASNSGDAGYGLGAGYGFASNVEIGKKQADAARAVLGGGMTSVKGSVRSVHVFVDMATHEFVLPNGTRVGTCPAAMGFSFAGGTTDGPGAFDFIQGDNKTSQNPFWEIVKDVITPDPSKEQVACQYPKPILLNTGYAHEPYEWSPGTVDVQLLRVGNFVMLIIPGELTTMAGRRIREAVRAELISSGVVGEDAQVVVAGPANTYGHYITTREEYSVQRYEGASTLYGPFTLEAYIDKYTSLVSFLGDVPPIGSPPSDEAPAEQLSKAISLQTSVKFDAAPIGKRFGQVVQDVVTTAPYRSGQSVFARFVGANPRNNLHLEGTFLSVDRLDSDSWTTVKSDSHPSTLYRWTRESTVLGTSTVNISWTIESDTAPGIYRIRYFGDSKPLIGSISEFVGSSSNFTVVVS